jgi:flagellar hook assembly protein FlgD
MKEAGYHSVRWNSNGQQGNKVSSGIYFCRINLNGESGKQYSKVLKMLLAK